MTDLISTVKYDSHFSSSSTNIQVLVCLREKEKLILTFLSIQISSGLITIKL